MAAALQTHFTENSKQIFPEMKLRGLVQILYSCICERFIYLYHRYMNVEIENVVAQFNFWEHMNRILYAVCNQTDSN